MAKLQHASVSTASNQYNGLSDKDGGVHSHSRMWSISRDCIVTKCMHNVCTKY